MCLVVLFGMSELVSDGVSESLRVRERLGSERYKEDSLYC